MDNNLDRLLKKYIKINEEYKQALVVINKHKKIQEQIKDELKSKNLNSYTINQDKYHATIEFKPIKTSRFDIPEEIKSRYRKETNIFREYFTIFKS